MLQTLLSGIQAEVNHMRQTVNLVSNESQKLLVNFFILKKIEPFVVYWGIITPNVIHG